MKRVQQRQGRGSSLGELPTELPVSEMASMPCVLELQQTQCIYWFGAKKAILEGG